MIFTGAKKVHSRNKSRISVTKTVMQKSQNLRMSNGTPICTTEYDLLSKEDKK